ncbi:histidine phosphatase family protein [Homoserinibacter sp. GY 40078]|uniref:histidine phosphatase family protein n=1 Tax=Homoserinibacter sp. GY 40078 TaxID=2603275 RepID=UPI0011CB3685|nr:histidine phosphatase family protein [Homoserinibacter sp. GY 40078]TXK17617.1 histidine phosphatase family protein [Homoserinibacter sp. GY 40078]
MTELYLVRHGETDWNAARRIQGRTDIPLNDTGRAQARQAGELLARQHWDAVYASPLSRAAETAQIIADRIGIDAVQLDDALMERDYGAAEGLGFDEIAARFPDGVHADGQESREDVGRRVAGALVRIAASRPGERVVVVSHGGAIRGALNVADPETQHPRITNASVHSFRVDEGALRLVAFDDPLEDASLLPGCEDLDTQNAVEAQDDDGELVAGRA